jgi:recombination factor protein rarA
MSDLGYGAGYLYAHDYPGHFVQQQYLPDAIVGERFWQSDEANASEVQMMNRWRLRWGQKPEE